MLLLPIAFAADLTITSIPQTSATVGVLYAYHVVASDGTNNSLTYTLTTAPTGMTINNTGYISFLPVNSGTESVVVKVSNGTNQTTQTYTLTITQNTALTIAVPLLGGPKQRRSNPKAFDDNRKEMYTEGRIILKNTGNQKLIDFTATTNTASKFNVTFTDIPSSLDPNTEAVVKIKARVPEDLDAFFLDKTERKNTIGDVTINAKSSNVSVTAKQPLQMEAKNALIVRDVDVTVRSKVKNVDENDRVENLKIRDAVRLDIDLENLFSTDDNEDIDIRDVTIDIDTNTKIFDIDNKIDMNNIRANAIETGILTFYVEDDAQDGTYKISLEAQGEDDNGALHGDRISFNLEVVRKQNEISVEKITTAPEKLSCTTKQATIHVLLHNTGKSNEEKAAIKVESKEFSERRQQLKIDRDDFHEEKFTLPLQPGKNVVQIEAFYDNDKVSATEGYTIEMPDCGAAIIQEIVASKKEEGKPVVEEQKTAEQEKQQETMLKELIPLAEPEAKPGWPYVLLGMSLFGGLATVFFLFGTLLKWEKV